MESDIINALSVFGFGVVFGWLIRRPEVTLEHRFGEAIKQKVLAVHERRKFVGDGFTISVTDELDFPDGRKIKIIVREGADQ